MRTCFALALVLVAGVLVAAPASAQTDRKVGVTLGYPAQVGVVWHISGRVALRPEFSVSRTSSESSNESEGLFGSPPITIQTKGSSYGATGRITLLITVKDWNELRVYAAPAYAYSHGSSTSTTTILGFTPPPTPPGFPPTTIIGPSGTSTTSSHGHIASGSLGIAFTPHERFAVFAETGLRYSSSTAPFGGNSKLRTVGTAGTIGAVLYF